MAELNAQWEAGRAERETGWRAEELSRRQSSRRGAYRLRDWVRDRALRAAFPGFRLNLVRHGDEEVGTRYALNLGLTAAKNTNAGAAIKDAEFPGLVAAWDTDGDWTALVDWLVAHPHVGNARFRTALRFLAGSDPDGWRAWCEAPATAA